MPAYSSHIEPTVSFLALFRGASLAPSTALGCGGGVIGGGGLGGGSGIGGGGGISGGGGGGIGGGGGGGGSGGGSEGEREASWRLSRCLSLQLQCLLEICDPCDLLRGESMLAGVVVLMPLLALVVAAG
jgi:hypothetical protein